MGLGRRKKNGKRKIIRKVFMDSVDVELSMLPGRC